MSMVCEYVHRLELWKIHYLNFRLLWQRSKCMTVVGSLRHMCYRCLVWAQYILRAQCTEYMVVYFRSFPFHAR